MDAGTGAGAPVPITREALTGFCIGSGVDALGNCGPLRRASPHCAAPSVGGSRPVTEIVSRSARDIGEHKSHANAQ